MDTNAMIAVVEDDSEIRDLVRDFLERERFAVLACANGAELDAQMRTTRPDVIVLDLMMPGEDGLSICRRISAAGGPPIIILSAKGEDIDRIVGLEIGADDYLAKPFNPRELVARIRALLRRGQSAPAQTVVEDEEDRELYRFAGFSLDVDGRVLTRGGSEVTLSNGEFALLTAFVRRPRRVLSREQLLDLTRGPDAAPVDRAIDVQLSRLRRKLADDPSAPALIKTVRGDGYLFSADVSRGGRP